MAGTDLTGEVIDRRYQILERIGGGAMGWVYRAKRLNLDRSVAIKVMHQGLPEGMKARERFEREAQMMARIDHPHCVSIIDYGVHAQKPYVVMELVRGRSLFDMLAEHGRLEPTRAVELMLQLLSGLAHAHDQGIVHRDIKPANLMVTPKAPLGLHLRILDFGLARLLGASGSLSNGMAVGTPSYMAPEQCRGDETIGPAVDVYACGVVLFEMLTGKKPLTDPDPLNTVRKQLNDPPPRLADVAPGRYGDLEQIVARALRKDPVARFPSVIAMSDALDAVLGDRSSASSTAVMPQITVGDAPAPSVSITVAAPSCAESEEVALDVRARAPSRHERPIPAAKARIEARDDEAVTRPRAPSRSSRWIVLLMIAGGAAGAAYWWRTQRERATATDARGSAIPGASAIADGSVSTTTTLLGPGSDAAGSSTTTNAAPGVAEIDAADATVVVANASDANAENGAPLDAVVGDAAELASVPEPGVGSASADPISEVIAKAQQFVDAGKVDAALELIRNARGVYGDRASLPLYAGKLYFARMWWSDGVANLRAAIDLDPSVRADPDLAAIVVKGFLTTPDYDARLAGLVLDLGAAALPFLDDAAVNHRAPELRARATALAKRVRSKS